MHDVWIQLLETSLMPIGKPSHPSDKWWGEKAWVCTASDKCWGEKTWVSTASDKCWDEKTWVGTRLAIETGIINMLTRSLYIVGLE